MAWVYILLCADGSYYVGSTKNLDGRMEQHASGRGAKYTSKRLPIVLIWACETERVDEAWALEKRIQGWSRVKCGALMENRFEDLRGLSGSAYKRAQQSHAKVSDSDPEIRNTLPSSRASKSTSSTESKSTSSTDQSALPTLIE